MHVFVFKKFCSRFMLGALLVLLLQSVSGAVEIKAQSSFGEQSTFSTPPATANDKPTTKIDPGKVVKFTPILGTYGSNGEIRIEMDLASDAGFTIYKSEMEIIPPAGFTVEIQQAPTPIKFNDPVTGGEVLVYERGSFHLKFLGIGAMQNPFDFAVKFTGCTKDFCLFPFTQNVRVDLLKSEFSGTTPPGSTSVKSKTDETSPIKIKSPMDHDHEIRQPTSSKSVPVALLILAIILLVMEVFYIKKNRQLSLITPALVLCGVFIWLYNPASKEKKLSNSVHTLSWITDENQAFAAAKQKNKPIFFESWADWCKPCKKMEAETFRDPELQAKLRENYVLLKIDMTDSNDVTDAVMDKYAIDSLPTMILIDVAAQRRKYIKRFVNPEELQQILKDFEADRK